MVNSAAIITDPTLIPEVIKGVAVDVDRTYNSYRACLIEQRDSGVEPAWSPGGTADADTTGVMSTWLSPGSITVPSWATKALIQCLISGVYDQTTANHAYAIQLALGANLGSAININGMGINNRFGIVVIYAIALSTTGSLAFTVRSQRNGGANSIRADGASAVYANINFK